MPIISFFQLGGNKFSCSTGNNFILKPFRQFFGKCFGTPDIPHFKDGRADGHVFARETNALVDISGGMTYLEAHIPQHIEDIFHHLFAPDGLLIWQHKQQIDVRPWRQRATAITTNGTDRHFFCIGGIVVGIYMGDCKIEYDPDQFILQEGDATSTSSAVAIFKQIFFGKFTTIGIGLF